MKFSLVHPSRGRAQMAINTYRNWMAKISGLHTIEHILSIDDNDPQLEQYKHHFAGVSNMLINPNRNCVKATDMAAKESTGDILIYLSDDFDCPDKWDEIIANIAAKTKKTEYAIWVNDGGQGRNTVMTIPIINRALYNALGYLYNPLYRSMWVDVDLWHVCNLRRSIIDAKDVMFRHNHWSTGAAMDTTYREHDNPQRNSEGLAIFNRRKEEGFLTEGVVR